MTKMKKAASKLIAIAFAFLMALGCVNTAFASEPTQSTRPTIDGSAKGSITLYKYDSSQGGYNAENPDKSVPVGGATFSAYRIINYVDGKYEVNDNFKTSGIKLEDVVGASGNNTSYGSTDDLEALIAQLQAFIKSNSSITVDATGTTESDGKATLGKKNDNNTLPLGVYLVQETVVPEGYVISSQAFLVTLPEWNREEKDGEVVEKWVYDVTAYPKDEAITAGKEMVKTEEDEKGEDVEVGATSDSYSIGDTIDYKVTAKIPDYGFTLGDSNKRVTTELLEQGAAEDPANFDKYNKLKVVFTDTLSEGLTLIMNDLTASENKKSDLSINVLGAGENGENVTLKGAIVTKDNNVQLKAVTGYDKTTGKITYNNDAYPDFLVTVDTTKKDDDENAVTEMKVDISWSALDAYQGEEIELRYSARLNEKAAIAIPNSNGVTYRFTNDPQQTTENPETTITPPGTDTYTYQLDLTKLLNNVEPEKVNGVDVRKVTFRLYVGDSTDALYVTKTDEKDENGDAKEGVYTIRTDGKPEGSDESITQDIHPDGKGALHIKGFEAGTYRLEETSSADGYTLLTAPIRIKVEEEFEDEGKTKVTGTVKACIVNADGTDGESLVTTNAGDGTDAKDGIFKLTVNNVKKQFNLPQTGGLGLWMFTIAGGILMAAIIFFHKLRMRKGKNA